MRTYLRATVGHPDRVRRLVEEIELLLGEGPSDRVLDLLDEGGLTGALLRGSDGAEPEVHLARMLPHLRGFLAGGERCPDAPPETGWEWGERFPELAGLCGACFHQDWREEHGDQAGALAHHLDGLSADPDARDRLGRELEVLVAWGLGEDALETAFSQLNCFSSPPGDMTWRQWAETMRNRVAGRGAGSR